jgi:hypothetical protein
VPLTLSKASSCFDWGDTGSSQKVRRAQILLKADADGPGWIDSRIAESFNCRVQTIENLRKRLVTEGFELDELSDHALGRSQGGFGTKVHVVCEGRGGPLGVVLTPGQQHESTVFEAVMDTVRIPQRGRRPRRRPRRVAGDKAYNHRRIQGWLRRRRMGAIIPRFKN